MTPSPRGGLPPGPPVPTPGVVRVSYDPGALPAPTDVAGPNRYDDPRPRTLDRYVMRYTARTLRGCLLELLDHLRTPDPAATAREAAVVDDADTTDLIPDGLIPGGQQKPWRAVRDFLSGRHVGVLQAPVGTTVVSVHDPAVQAALDDEPGVRALLDTDEGRAALSPAAAPSSSRPHLDGAAVRLSTDLGRALTQAISLALRDQDPHLGGIHYRSRHDDTEDCWALYDQTPVTVTQVQELSPHAHDHKAAMHDVATTWSLELPPEWH